jgi:hypothetical protein
MSHSIIGIIVSKSGNFIHMVFPKAPLSTILKFCRSRTLEGNI